MSDTKTWGVRLVGDGKAAVPGRIAEVTYGGEPVRGVRDVVVRLPLDGVAAMTVEVLLSDADVGGLLSEQVTMRGMTLRPCSDCEGTGEVPTESDGVTCKTCDGTGQAR